MYEMLRTKYIEVLLPKMKSNVPST